MKTYIVKATHKNALISPKKARVVLKYLKGKNLDHAGDQLKFSSLKASQYARVILNSCIANASKKGYNLKGAYIHSAISNKGIVLKRFRAGSRGSSKPILRRRSHMTIAIACLA